MIEIEIKLSCHLPDHIFDSQVEDVVCKIRAHQKLRREIVDRPHIVLRIVLPGRKPASQNPVPHRIRESHEVIQVGCDLDPLADYVEEIVKNSLLESNDRIARPVVIHCQIMLFGYLLQHSAPRSCGVEKCES